MPNSFSISGNIVDVISGRIFPGTIAVSEGKITSLKPVESTDGPYILPGLVDAHIHIESSMLTPSEFARMAVVHGTVATVSDPHEIANVLGLDGVNFMIANGRKVPFHFFFGAPSCVPATGFETAGCTLGPAEVEELLKREDILYLSEMMNFPGVVYNDPDVHAKLALARKYNKPVDGHAPGVGGDMLKSYAAAGITTDHECSTLEEAVEKIGLGMKILVREGSAARNFDNLIPLLGSHPESVMFCSDDKHPDDLVLGHMNLLLRRAVKKGFSVMDAIRACTLNPVKHYRLDCGLLQEGDPADFILVDSLKEFNVLSTYVNGKLVADQGKNLINAVRSDKPNRFVAPVLESSMLDVPAMGEMIKVIQAYDGELLTGKMIVNAHVVDGKVQSDVEHDILKLAVINRYQASRPAIGFINGIGLKSGAIASTVAHDSHNLICVGTSDEEMMKAIRLLVDHKGGIAVTDGAFHEVLPLPVAGIMTDAEGKEVALTYEKINQAVHDRGSKLRAPFMTLSFMALLVIPELKLSDLGLFDGTTFSFTGLFEK